MGERAEAGGGIVAEVRLAWQNCLKHGRFGNADNFFALGGDSLDAIAMIATLQAAGHRVSTRTFLKEPTVEALARHLRVAADDTLVPALPRPDTTAPVFFEHFSPAQCIFFEQRLTRPDHHNQALMFDLDGPLSTNILGQAFERLWTWHPLLTTRYRRIYATWIAEQRSPDDTGPALQVTDIPMDLNRNATAVLIHRTSQALQASLSLERGKVFIAHLFRRESGTSHLLLCAHHVVVDAVSWRILVDDLTRVYNALLGTGAALVPRASLALQDWVDHVASIDALRADLTMWLDLPADVVRARIGVPLEGNLERHAKSIWLSFSRAATSALYDTLPETLAAPFHHILLAAYLHAFDEAESSRRVGKPRSNQLRRRR